jgi:hypothetical protein
MFAAADRGKGSRNDGHADIAAEFVRPKVGLIATQGSGHPSSLIRQSARVRADRHTH